MRMWVAVIVVAVVAAVAGAGCGKKNSLESQDTLSMAALSTLPADTVNVTATAPVASMNASMAAPALEPLPPGGPYKPNVKDIQAALKHAGFYAGSVDGKLGPKTKAAIEAFQKANGLTADGKVGPKTWAALSVHAAEAAAEVAPAQ